MLSLIIAAITTLDETLPMGSSGIRVSSSDLTCHLRKVGVGVEERVSASDLVLGEITPLIFLRLVAGSISLVIKLLSVRKRVGRDMPF